MAPQFLKSMDLLKTPKSEYLEDEALLSLQLKKTIHDTLRAKIW